MSMLDSFFNKGFKAAKCKTLLKLTIPRIKLLRNRRELQIKNMRRDIAKLLETGQEATARIRVEHIIREENMMAAQEILELFSELISVRLPIIETQRECPLDLKEAISSVCFAAPRCADLPELLQVQMQFAVKYGKEFVSATTELRPDCGVNRQLIELLSVRAPSPEIKLKLLKEIAEEHELDWDPAATENEFMKPHEDLLNGPTQFVSGSKLPLPEEKHDETLYSSSSQAGDKQPGSDTDFDELDFPEVPKVVLRPSTTAAATNSVSAPASTAAGSEIDQQSSTQARVGDIPEKPELVPEFAVQDRLADSHDEAPLKKISENAKIKQFLPFISPPPEHLESFASTRSNSPLPPSTMKSESNVDLQDVLAAAHAAAESAERAAAAVRSAATLAQVRIAELKQKKNDEVTTDSGADNPFSTDDAPVKQAVREELGFDRQDSVRDPDDTSDPVNIHQDHVSHQASEFTDLPSFDKHHMGPDSPILNYQTLENSHLHHQPQRLPSMDDEPYFSYPNLFRSSSASLSPSGSLTDNSRTTS